MTRLHTKTLCITCLIGPALLTVTHASPPDFETQLGVAHIGGLYSFSDTDYLNEGAAAAQNIGARKASPKSENGYKCFWLVRPDGTRSPICKLFKETVVKP